MMIIHNPFLFRGTTLCNLTRTISTGSSQPLETGAVIKNAELQATLWQEQTGPEGLLAHKDVLIGPWFFMGMCELFSVNMSISNRPAEENQLVWYAYMQKVFCVFFVQQSRSCCTKFNQWICHAYMYIWLDSVHHHSNESADYRAGNNH